MINKSKHRLSSDRLGVGTIAIVVVAILVIAAAGAGVYYLTKSGGGGGSDDGASFADPGIGSVMNYKMSSGSEGSGTITTTFVAENTTDYIVRIQMSISGESDMGKMETKVDEFTLNDGHTMLPDDAVAAGTETISTCDGMVEVTRYTSASMNSTYWVGNEDSGKKNQAIYKIESEAVTGSSITELTSYTLKKHVAYVPSPVIGTEYARYTSDGGSSVQAKYVAESSDYFCIEVNTGDLNKVYFLLSKTAGKAPDSFTDKGATTVVIGDKTYNTKGYAKTVMDMKLDGVSGMTSEIRLDIYSDGVAYRLTTYSAMGEFASEKVYTIVL